MKDPFKGYFGFHKMRDNVKIGNYGKRKKEKGRRKKEKGKEEKNGRNPGISIFFA